VRAATAETGRGHAGRKLTPADTAMAYPKFCVNSTVQWRNYRRRRALNEEHAITGNGRRSTPRTQPPTPKSSPISDAVGQNPAVFLLKTDTNPYS